ncbi:hypothetical protein IX51_03660 [uncultured archaeon]|nr:hypothetical protein IX51_03660 [uncultured archaeon]HKJ96879.1 polysaccharide deacetylase family protein [Thermoplasmataceae archaeon]
MVYERDFIGYGQNPPDVKWPDGKTLALSLVFNYEEGGEHSYPVDGVVESIGEFGPVDMGTRDVGMETVYEYGQRVGIWRILNLLKKKKVKATFYAAAKALEVNPAAAKMIVSDGHEICDHGYRWTETFKMTYEEEREEIRKSVETIERITGKKPVGFYAREPSENTIDILAEFDNFIYDSDSYDDDLPHKYKNNRLLIVPYTPDANDFHFLSPMHRFATSSQFLEYITNTFDVLYEESREVPKMMSAAFHIRVSGRPGRFPALVKFLDYVLSKKDVWIATREEIARYWLENYENKK